MQESARYIGVIPTLIDMVASYNASVSEVGRLALLSLRHRNECNAREITSVLRCRRCASPEASSVDSEQVSLRCSTWLCRRVP
jgi:hypothetical protein